MWEVFGLPVCVPPVLHTRIQLPPSLCASKWRQLLSLKELRMNHTPEYEQHLEHTHELLRCALATAYASADNLQGLNRDVALAVVHLIQQARTAVDRLLA
jgi:hypothetical protein